ATRVARYGEATDAAGGRRYHQPALDAGWRESGTCATRRHSGVPVDGGVTPADPTPAHSHHGQPRRPAWHFLGGAGCRRHHYSCVIVLLWRAEFPFSLVAGDRAELLDCLGVGGHLGH